MIKDHRLKLLLLSIIKTFSALPSVQFQLVVEVWRCVSFLIGCSRHNAPGRPHAVTDLIRANKSSGDVTILLLNDDPSTTAFSTGCAVARAFSTYALKKKNPVDPNVSVYYNHKFEEITPVISFDSTSANHLAASIQKCQYLVGKSITIGVFNRFCRYAS